MCKYGMYYSAPQKINAFFRVGGKQKPLLNKFPLKKVKQSNKKMIKFKNCAHYKSLVENNNI